jgi:hypothetical protein
MPCKHGIRFIAAVDTQPGGGIQSKLPPGPVTDICEVNEICRQRPLEYVAVQILIPAALKIGIREAFMRLWLATAGENETFFFRLAARSYQTGEEV